jgi:hypothetical protein
MKKRVDEQKRIETERQAGEEAEKKPLLDRERKTKYQTEIKDAVQQYSRTPKSSLSSLSSFLSRLENYRHRSTWICNH